MTEGTKKLDIAATVELVIWLAHGFCKRRTWLFSYEVALKLQSQRLMQQREISHSQVVTTRALIFQGTSSNAASYAQLP
jgi:hypothetical protein